MKKYKTLVGSLNAVTDDMNSLGAMGWVLKTFIADHIASSPAYIVVMEKDVSISSVPITSIVPTKF